LGKSTTSQQLVRLLKNDNCLAGGVFLTTLTKEHPEIVIQMISRQLGEMHPRAIAIIAEAARKLNGPHNPLREYFKAYIFDPIQQLEYPYQLIVVLDGLEEWANHESFLPELAHLPSPSPVKFILTSRPSYSVERILNKIAIQRYPLPPVSQEIVERYFSHHFERIDWRGRKPDQLVINRLATHAQGLLIWAATVCSLLSHKFDERRPHEILERILLSEENVGAQSGKQLERLYHGAISTLFPEDMRERLRNFLGAMMILQEPLPVSDFARLLAMPVHLAEEIQQQLAAFQTRGEFKSNIVPPAIQQFHFSFLEFMESPSTEHNGQPIAIDTANAHSMLANRCLQIVFSEFLPSYRGTTCGYSELRGVELYTIKFWPLHLSNGTSRLPLPSSPTAKDAMDLISEQDMRRWATLFLPCVAARFQESHGYDSLDNTPRSSLPYQLATIIGDNDVTTLSYQLHCLEIAVRLEPIDVPTWMALGSAYDRLYEHGRNIQSLDEEISIYRRALLLRPAPHADHLKSLNYLANALGTRFQHWGVSNDLDEAIVFHQKALLLRPVPHPDRWVSLYNLATALKARFAQRGKSSDLNEAILFFQEAILLQPAPHPKCSLSLNNLACALSSRFQHWGVSSDLDEAILFHQEALLLQPAPHPDRSVSLSNLTVALITRFKHRGVPSDLDEAILFSQEALLLQPAPHLDRSMSLNNLAAALSNRFQHRGVPSDLDEAILFHQEALLLRPVPHLDRSMSLSNLATALCARFQQRGVPSDLDEAILFLQEALLLQPATHPDHSILLNNLASALRIRFEMQGTINDRDEAILLHQEALLLQPVPHPDRSISLSNLATALCARFQQRGVPSDLDEAILFHQEALLLQPVPHPDHSMSLNNLAYALFTRFQQQGASNDLDEAILFLQEALLLQPATHPDHSILLNNLASALRIRFEMQGTINDRDEANLLCREAETLVL
jgi:tetratricopeptide (TPR) repeat protein